MNSLYLAVKAYDNARKRLNEAVESYLALCQNAGTNTVVLYNDVEPFASLNETLFWAMSIFDLKKELDYSTDYSEIERFMSALRLIVNIMKHSKTDFDPYVFSHPGISISVRVTDGENGPTFEDVQIKPTLAFADITDVIIEKRNKNQKKNYNNLIKGKKLSDIMDQLDTIIESLKQSTEIHHWKH